MGTKNKADCRSHYFATYVNVATAPLPDFSLIGRCKPVEPPSKPSASAAAAATAASADDALDTGEGGVSDRTFLSPGAVEKVGGNSSDITGYVRFQRMHLAARVDFTSTHARVTDTQP